MKRTPRWMLALITVFFGYFALLVYCDLRRPDEFGFEAEFTSGQMLLPRIAPGTPASRAGLQAGDVILTADGKPIHSLPDWSVVDSNVEFDRAIALRVQRAGGDVDVAISLQPAPWSYWSTGAGVFLLGVLAVQLVALLLALVILVKRPDDVVAQLGAWCLATIGVYTIVLPYRIAAVWRGLPRVAGALLLVPYINSLAVAAVLCTFFVNFPQKRHYRPVVWLALWAPMALALWKPTEYVFALVFAPQRATAGLVPGRVLVAATAAYTITALTALWMNYTQLTDVNERRRLNVLVIGSIGGIIPGFFVVASYWMRSRANFAESIFASRATALGTLSLLFFPGSFAYAILRHRLFDISVMIRQGVQYALARRVLGSLVPALAVLLAADILLHGDQPLSAVLKSRGWAYGGVAALAAVAHLRRQHWLSALDRHFFREHYNAQQILRFVAEDIRRVGDFERVTPRVVAQINAAFHPEFVALLVRDPHEVSYRALVAMPPGFVAPTLRVDSTLVALLRVLGKPLEVSAGQIEWLRQQLPADEVDFLQRSRLDLLVPIVTNPERSESVLALGVKRSEEPYTRQDLDLLTVIASNLALLLERPATVQEPALATFDECPDCGACYDTGTMHCPRDGVALASILLSRVLAARYQLDHRLGGGGLGTVYAALDTALDRHVAVKVIRDDLVTNDDVARRFQREARIAAAFVHPNVVTVHDFGVTAGGRAFLVMELLTGTTLREELRRRHRLAPEQTIRIMRDVCAAIEAAHRRQLVHRDLKPENIFLVESESGVIAKVLDFGIAKVLARDTGQMTREATGAGILLGTLPYMAPELLRGEDVHPTSDLWALAVIAYELLTGDHPFAAYGVPVAPQRPIAAIEPIAGSRGLQFFTRALAVHAADRPETPASFFAELERALAPL